MLGFGGKSVKIGNIDYTIAVDKNPQGPISVRCSHFGMNRIDRVTVIFEGDKIQITADPKVAKWGVDKFDVTKSIDGIKLAAHEAIMGQPPRESITATPAEFLKNEPRCSGYIANALTAIGSADKLRLSTTQQQCIRRHTADYLSSARAR